MNDQVVNTTDGLDIPEDLKRELIEKSKKDFEDRKAPEEGKPTGPQVL